MNQRELENQVRRFEVDGRKIECEAECSGCEFLSECKRLEEEVLRYRPDVRSLGAELHQRSTIFPLIDTDSETRARKLYQVLIELAIADRMKKRWNSFDLAKNIGISVFKVRRRLQYLIERKFVKADEKGWLIFSFGRVVHGLIKVYSAEFEKRFGRRPRIAPEDAGVLSPLVSEYSDEDLRSMISKYLELDDQFLRDCGYALRFFPGKINRLLIALGTRNAPKASSLTREQLEEYIKGKESGSWIGNEDWAAPYEKALKSLQASTSE